MNGPIGYPHPNFIPLSISSTLPTPSSKARIASSKYGTSNRFTMNPERSDVLIGVFPKLAANFIACSITSGDVVIVPTTSTSFIKGTGLKKCIPMNRSTRLVAVIISVITSDDVLLAKIAAGFTILSIAA